MLGQNHALVLIGVTDIYEQAPMSASWKSKWLKACANMAVNLIFALFKFSSLILGFISQMGVLTLLLWNSNAFIVSGCVVTETSLMVIWDGLYVIEDLYTVYTSPEQTNENKLEHYWPTLQA